MKASLCEVLKIAEEKNIAIGAFNTPTLENMLAVIKTAEKLGTPVIISHAECHEPWAKLDEIGPVMVFEAERAKVPVCVHLDHGEHVDYVKHAIDLGFTSAMFDGSALDYEHNVECTRDVVAYAHARNVSVEAEIGTLAAREGGQGPNGGAVYTDPDLALKFVKETGIDALAASFGTAHGIYKVAPKLDFDRIRKIRALTGVPLVMHGGSGVSHEDYRTAISCGIRKINYYSYMARAGVSGARKYLENDVTFYHEVADAVIKAMAEDVEKAMKVFMGQ